MSARPCAWSNTEARPTPLHPNASAPSQTCLCAFRVARKLEASGHSVCAYHAGKGTAVREQIQQDWMSGSIQFIIATVAFGMCASVSHTLHLVVTLNYYVLFVQICETHLRCLAFLCAPCSTILRWSSRNESPLLLKDLIHRRHRAPAYCTHFGRVCTTFRLRVQYHDFC